MTDLPPLLPPPPDDVYGDISLSTTTGAFTTDAQAVRIVQDLSHGATHRKVVGHVMLPNELLMDTGVGVGDVLWKAADRTFRPWLYPDRPAFPPMVLFPGIERWSRWLRRWLRR